MLCDYLRDTDIPRDWAGHARTHALLLRWPCACIEAVRPAVQTEAARLQGVRDGAERAAKHRQAAAKQEHGALEATTARARGIVVAHAKAVQREKRAFVRDYDTRMNALRQENVKVRRIFLSRAVTGRTRDPRESTGWAPSRCGGTCLPCMPIYLVCVAPPQRWGGRASGRGPHGLRTSS